MSYSHNFSFLSDVYHAFSGLLPSNVMAAEVTAKAPDPKNIVVVNGDPPGPPLPLNVGLTVVNIEVTSADESKKKVTSPHRVCCMQN